MLLALFYFFFSSRRRHTIFDCDWSSDVCSSDLTYATHNLYVDFIHGLTVGRQCIKDSGFASLRRELYVHPEVAFSRWLWDRCAILAQAQENGCGTTSLNERPSSPSLATVVEFLFTPRTFFLWSHGDSS